MFSLSIFKQILITSNQVALWYSAWMHVREPKFELGSIQLGCFFIKLSIAINS